MKLRTVICFLFLGQTLQGQLELHQLIQNLNRETIPYISVSSVKQAKEKIILLDARELEEFEVSHLSNAIHVGYNNFNLQKTIQELPQNKNTKIVVYCSLGMRSEKVAEQLEKVGYLNIFNLYGGIFEWKNHGNIVVDKNNKITEKVHAFNRKWGKWLIKGIKIYE